MLFRSKPFLYPANFSSAAHVSIGGHYDRSIYQNVCDILRIIAEFNNAVDSTKYDPFKNSKDYMDIFLGSGTTHIHQNFAGFIHEYCMQYKDEVKLLELCKEEILPYVANDYNYPELNKLQQKLQKIINNLNSKPKGVGAAAFNIHD